MPEKILIANRGEIAIRIMKACDDLGLDYVAVYTEEDKDSMHVKLVEEKKYHDKRLFRISNYRDTNDLLAVADFSSCTALHPGYGFLAEDYRFARRLEKRDHPLTFIGPSWEAVRNFGSKINTKTVAKKLNIPTIPGSDRLIYNEIEAEELAEEIFEFQQEQKLENPSVLVKASAGGGGMGIEEAKNINEFRRIFRRVRNYAKKHFGDEGVLIEQFMRDFNHVEVQIVSDRYGNVVHYGTRNCSVQSTARQKRIEVSPGFDPTSYAYHFDATMLLEKIVNHSLKLCREVGYDNVGTWEWIVTKQGLPYLMEVNARIQVENDVSGKTARITNRPRSVNLLQEQIRLALGERLNYSQTDLHFDGASIEFRIIAEDTKRDFVPCPGIIKDFKYPAYDWLHVYTHLPVDKPYRIPSQYDPNLALGVIWGKDLTEAKDRGLIFLRETTIMGTNNQQEPITTNLDFLTEKVKDLLKF